jgi:hypothetical protein
MSAKLPSEATAKSVATKLPGVGSAGNLSQLSGVLMRLNISCELPTLLVDELYRAASESRTSPETFAAQTIEAGLAARRLPKIQAGAHGPRIAAGWQPKIAANEVALRDAPLLPAEVPTLADLTSVEDIT